ncbi:hypothetical protein IW262DRAFT_1302740 [Armillaria fumosa]|nr:hypothetical protein IW262DRAFT_1302740 [Armillaria fumosa]
MIFLACEGMPVEAGTHIFFDNSIGQIIRGIVKSMSWMADIHERIKGLGTPLALTHDTPNQTFSGPPVVLPGAALAKLRVPKQAMQLEVCRCCVPNPKIGDPS